MNQKIVILSDCHTVRLSLPGNWQLSTRQPLAHSPPSPPAGQGGEIDRNSWAEIKTI